MALKFANEPVVLFQAREFVGPQIGPGIACAINSVDVESEVERGIINNLYTANIHHG